VRDVNEVKNKFTLESLTELIQSEQESIVQIRSKAKEVTEEMIGLRNVVSDKKQKSLILEEEISNLRGIRGSIVESIYEELIDQHVVENGIQDYSAKPKQKAKRKV
jgi:DNA-binding protein H-NS